MNSPNCPCCSNKVYQDCCSLFIDLNQAPHTALQLMRSRYTAYVKHNLDYLQTSWHHSTRPENGVASDLGVTQWSQLYIIEAIQGRVQDNSGTVEFVAYFLNNKNNAKMHEISHFIKQHNKWFYVDGEIIENSTFQPGRNSPCYCGSGKKYKHCCLT